MRTLSSFLRRDVVTESGIKLGRCYDLRAELTATRLRVTGLCVARQGWMQRLGIPTRGRPSIIPWHTVTKIEGRQIIVRDPPRVSRSESPGS
jgi:sporulation protein YlmC with PRC-barrel domain